MTLSKDWSGNKTTVFSTIGSSSHSDRERAERDLYTTNQVDFVRFIKALRRDGIQIQGPVWECASGCHHLVEVLERLGYEVVSTDIEDRSEWPEFRKTKAKLQKIDVLETTGVDLIKWDVRSVITNPPYSIADQFVSHIMPMLQDKQYLMLLLRIQWLESKKRYALFKKHNYKYVYVYVSRANCYRNAQTKDDGGAICFAWFIYEKGYTGDTVVRFIE